MQSLPGTLRTVVPMNEFKGVVFGLKIREILREHHAGLSSPHVPLQADLQREPKEH